MSRLYRADGWQGWFVAEAPNLREARKLATAEFGTGNTQSVRRATDEDRAAFLAAGGRLDSGAHAHGYTPRRRGA